MASLCTGTCSWHSLGVSVLTQQVELDLYFRSSFCNDWPLICISANEQVLWQDRIQESAVVSVRFPARAINTVRIEYVNKRNGPEVWDTAMDAHGNITQDQHCILERVMINRCRCQWLISKIPYHYLDGSQRLLHGFMDLRGFYQFDFPEDVYRWVLENRRQELPHVSQNSSLAYETIYIPDSNNEQAAAMVQELKQLLEQVP